MGLTLVVPGSSATLDMSLNLSEPHLQIGSDHISYLYGLNEMISVKWGAQCRVQPRQMTVR